MNNELKKAIINYIFDNIDLFQLTNNAIENFREYIYNSEGGYLIGGEEVADFIRDAEKLIEGE